MTSNATQDLVVPPSVSLARAGMDRRRGPVSARHLLFGGRRIRMRRAEEAARPHLVDRYDPRLVGMSVLLMTLSIADAVATLLLLNSGCEEVNPAMRVLLDHGVGSFLAGKLALTGAGCLVLVIFHKYPLFRSALRVGHVLPILIGLYATLNAYQAVLLFAS
jgi:hypothetical protein